MGIFFPGLYLGRGDGAFPRYSFGSTSSIRQSNSCFREHLVSVHRRKSYIYHSSLVFPWSLFLYLSVCAYNLIGSPTMTEPKFRVAIWCVSVENYLRELIVMNSGGGIGGLICALALSVNPDISVDVYEAAAQFTEVGAGIGKQKVLP